MKDALYKLLVLAGVMLLVLGGLGGYVAWLQLFRNTENDAKERRQQDRLTYTPGERGAILDRNGIVLDKCIPQYDMALRIEVLRDPRDTRRRTVDKAATAISELAVFLGAEYYRTRPSREAILRHLSKNTPMPFVLWKALPQEVVSRWSMHRNEFPAFDLVMSWRRHHYYPSSAFHLRGMTAFGLPANPPKVRNFSLNFMELTGRSGIEAACDAQLRGQGGVDIIRTDVLSYRTATLDSVSAQRGKDVRLTIDIKLQQEVEEIFRMNRYQGALVLMNVKNGEILASVSEPSASFDGQGAVADGAMLNRVLAGYYPPGSTLKPLVALVALDRGVLTAEQRIVCEGYYSLGGDKRLSCSHVFGCGALDVREALGRSCNTFFCETGHLLGRNGLDALVNGLHLGERVGTELAAEEREGIAFVPSKYSRCSWGIGDYANASIGQGAWIITPLQLVEMTGAITSGYRVHPHYVIGNEEPPVQMSWKPEVRAIVLDGMRACTEAAHGTGHAMRMAGCSLLAKTGTAQTGRSLPNAVMIAAIPAEAPRLVGVCIVEHTGAGGTYAAPILKYAFQRALEMGY